MKLFNLAAAPLLFAPLLCQASPVGLLKALSEGFSAPVPAELSGPAADRAQLPLYNELPDLMLSEPMSSYGGERIWLLPSMRFYKSLQQAELVMGFWKSALEKAGVKVVSAKVLAAGETSYEFELRYSGDSYAELYAPRRELFADQSGADAARERAEELFKKAGLKLVASMTARSGAEYLPMVYYLVNYRAGEENRLKACAYRPGGLHPSEAAARERALLDKAAFESAGLPVLGVELITGPKGSLYQLHYIGKDSQPRKTGSPGFASAAEAQAAMAAEVRRLENSGAAILEAGTFASSSWPAELYSYNVRYISKN
jgi:hypothetical protein